MATKKTTATGSKRPMATDLPIPDDEPAGALELSEAETAETDPDAAPTPEVEELEDGSAIVHDLDTKDPKSTDFFDNIVDDVDEGLLGRISTELLESVTRDKEARKRRDEQYAEGIKRTGLGNEAPGGATFDGASKAVHPVLVEACIDFSARAMKELFPAKGPVKTHIIGKQTDEKLQKAERKKTYMNWQLTKQAREYRTELEQLTTQLPLGGSQYMKVWQDTEFERPRFEFVPIDDVYLPFASTDFYTTARLTHVIRLTKQEFETRVRNGTYRDVIKADMTGTTLPEDTASRQATDKIEGRDDDYNQDGLRDIFEIQVKLDLEGDDSFVDEDEGPVPYIITIDESTNKVLAIRRNWKEDDEKKEKLHWLVEWAFLPWRGAYAIGLGQAMGTLAGAATGALRALLDAAHIANFPAALKLKGARMSSQTTSVAATGLTDIEGPTAIDDIRKLAMPFPFPGPNTILFELMKYCAESAKSVVNTADEKISDSSSQMPVGTALALIEQGSITFSSIHSRLHESQRRVLEILHRLDGEYLEDETTVEELGELVVRREDFTGPMDVLPVSDPNIFSDTQRYAQQQAVLQLKGMFPTAFKDNELLERTLQLLNYPDYQEVLNLPLKPEQRDPIKENVEARDPQSQLKVYPNEDDEAHLKVHLAFMSSPILCANPIMAMPALPKLITHCAEHIIALYEKHSKAASLAARTTGLASGKQYDASAQAEGIMLAERELIKIIGPMWDHLTKLAEMAKSLVPPAPTDPKIQVAQMEIAAEDKREGARLAQDKELKTQAMQTSAQKDMATLQGKQQGEMVAAQTKAQTEASKEQGAAARHTEEMAIAAENARLAEQSEQRAQQFNAMIAQMREDAASERQASEQAFTMQLETMRQESAQVLEVLKQALGTKAALATAVVDAELRQMEIDNNPEPKGN